MKCNLVVLAAAVLLTGMVATHALAAGHGGGHIGGRFGEPLIGSAPMTSPIYNPSPPYTVTQSPEVHVGFLKTGCSLCLYAPRMRCLRCHRHSGQI